MEHATKPSGIGRRTGRARMITRFFSRVLMSPILCFFLQLHERSGKSGGLVAMEKSPFGSGSILLARLACPSAIYGVDL
jgi:hypothetical protein